MISEQNQIRAIDNMVHKCPRLQVIFVVHDLEVHIKGITVPQDVWLNPLGTPNPSASGGHKQFGHTRTPIKEELAMTLKKPRSANKILMDGLGDIMVALQSADSDE